MRLRPYRRPLAVPAGCGSKHSPAESAQAASVTVSRLLDRAVKGVDDSADRTPTCIAAVNQSNSVSPGHAMHSSPAPEGQCGSADFFRAALAASRLPPRLHPAKRPGVQFAWCQSRVGSGCPWVGHGATDMHACSAAQGQPQLLSGLDQACSMKIRRGCTVRYPGKRIAMAAS